MTTRPRQPGTCLVAWLPCSDATTTRNARRLFRRCCQHQHSSAVRQKTVCVYVCACLPLSLDVLGGIQPTVFCPPPKKDTIWRCRESASKTAMLPENLKRGTWCGRDASSPSILGPEHATDPAHALYAWLLTYFFEKLILRGRCPSTFMLYGHKIMTFENICLIIVSLWCKAHGASPSHEWALLTQAQQRQAYANRHPRVMRHLAQEIHQLI